MSQEQHIRALEQVFSEALSKGNFDVLDDLFAPTYIEHQFGIKPTLSGAKEDFAFLRNAFPDLTMTIEDVIASEDKVWVRVTARGTHTGPFMGPPTGRSMEITVFDVVRFEDGVIVEHWGAPDRFALMSQLGLLPQPGA